LIKREIQARNFFLLCDSGNAKSSKWVQGTIAHVKSLQTKQVETIDLDADWQAQIDGIQAIVRHATVFLSFAQTNDAAIAPVRTGLIENDFFTTYRLATASLSKILCHRGVRTVGFFIHFLSRASLRT
jgi:hypothetical protein